MEKKLKTFENIDPSSALYTHLEIEGQHSIIQGSNVMWKPTPYTEIPDRNNILQTQQIIGF